MRTVNTLSAIDCAYLAGLIDGEGSIRARRRKGGGISIELAVCMTDRQAVDWAALTTGAGKVWFKKEARANRKDVFYWKVGHINEAAQVVRQIKPYLKIKQAQASGFLAIAALRATKTHPTATRTHGGAEDRFADIVTGLKHGESLERMFLEALDLAQYLKQALMEQVNEFHTPADQAEAVERVARSVHLLASGYHSEAKAQANYALNLLGFPNADGQGLFAADEVSQ